MVGPEDCVGGRCEEGDELVAVESEKKQVTQHWEHPAHVWITGQLLLLGCRVWEWGQ